MFQIQLQKNLRTGSGNMNLDLALEIKPGTFLTLYGKSGAGKTSVLRMIAGLFMPDTGKIISGNNTWLDTKNKINLPPQKRKVGLVFQDYALFPNMTVRENLEFALSKSDTKNTISELIEIIELGDLQNRRPKTLSGGQKQRVALARALVQRPEILMLDEPLSALDHEMRTKLQTYILNVHREFKLTTILVSHDIPEIVKLSDWVVNLEKGKVIQQGKPAKMFSIEKEGELIGVEKVGEEYLLNLLIQNESLSIRVPSAVFKSYWLK